jgi:predicted SAM-dependent methyltransferase
MGRPSAEFVAGEPLVLAPDVVIRAHAGRFVVQAGVSPTVFETEDPRLVGWICGFVRPLALARVLDSIAPAERAGALDLIARLRRAGLLRSGGAAAAPADAEREHRENLQRLAGLATSVYELAGDLRGMGPFAGTSVSERLSAVTAAVESLRAELEALRPAHLQRQLSAAGVAAADGGLKLHIGSGEKCLPGWVNMDVYPAPVALNVNRGLPFADRSARFVFLSHLLEHLFYPQEALRFLGEILRVLVPGGVVRIIVPDIEQCLRAYVENDREFFDSRSKTWTWWPERATRLEDFLAYAGAGPNPGHLFESHKFGYDFETLKHALEKAGFDGVRRCSFMQSPEPELRVDTASLVADARHGDRYYSLFVEAGRPPAGPADVGRQA